MTAFEEVEDLKKSKEELEQNIKYLQYKYEMLDFKHMVVSGLGAATSNILGGVFFVFVSSYIAAFCLHQLSIHYSVLQVVKDVTWFDIACAMYIVRCLMGGFIRVPRIENG
jgi:hypothetical protein